MRTEAAMTQTLPEPEGVKLALSHIDEAKEGLRLASEILSALMKAEARPEALPAGIGTGRQLDIGEPPTDILHLAQAIINSILPEQLTHRARERGATERDWLYRVQRLSIAPRGIAEPVATLAVMLAAVKFGLRHQLLLQTEKRLGLPHKTPIPQLDIFLETFLSEMLEADRADVRFNDWLKRLVSGHYPGFGKSKVLDLPNGDYILIPNEIEPIRDPSVAPITATALTSPVDPGSAVVIPLGSGWRITLGYAEILYDDSYPTFHGKHHSGIDIYRWNGHKAPVYAMRSGLVVDSVYLPKGFGNTVTIEHDDGACLRYTHLDRKLVKKGDRVVRGQQIGTVGKGAKDIYAAHLHLDMPRSRMVARAGTYYDTVAEVAERFIDPLSRIPAGV